MTDGPTVEGPCPGHNKNCFTKFSNGGVVASVGDTVCAVNNQVDDGISLETCLIGTLKEIFRIDHKHGQTDWHAGVQWYRRPHQLPMRADCDALDPAIEVVREEESKLRIVDLDEIFSTCKIVDAYMDDNPHDLIQREKAQGVEAPVFVCRFALNRNPRAPKILQLKPIKPLNLLPKDKYCSKKPNRLKKDKTINFEHPKNAKSKGKKLKASKNAAQVEGSGNEKPSNSSKVLSPSVNLKLDTSGCCSNVEDLMDAIDDTSVSDEDIFPVSKTKKRMSTAKSSKPVSKVLAEKPFNRVDGISPIKKVLAETSGVKMSTEDLCRMLEDGDDSTKENGKVSNDSPQKQKSAQNVSSPPLNQLSPCQMYGSTTKRLQGLRISSPYKASVRRRLDSPVGDEHSTNVHSQSEDDETDSEIARVMINQNEVSKDENGAGKISLRRKSTKGEVDDRPVSKASWVSELLDVNEPVIEDGGRCITPIRLSLRRIRLDSPPLKENDEEPVQLECRLRRRSHVQAPSTPSSTRALRTRAVKSLAEEASDTDDSRPGTPRSISRSVARRKRNLTVNNNQLDTSQGASQTSNRSVRARKRQNIGNESMDDDGDDVGESDFTPMSPSKKKRTPTKTFGSTEMMSPRERATPLAARGLTDVLSPPESTTPLASRLKIAGVTAAKTPSKTPVKTPSKVRCNIAPSMPTRASLAPIPQTALELARANLHVSSVPTSLPCRETEFQNIHCFVEGKIRDSVGGCMYISGMPGTGKTATVHAVVRSLSHKVQAGHLPDFQYIEVNGLRLTEPRQVFVQILRQLTGQKCAPQQAQDILATRFNSGKKRNKTVVLLVDEVDMLRNRRQDVVYNLFDWPSKPHSRLIVLTIANTMDLPERLLMGRVTSRLGLTRLTFQPYTYKQLQEIVSARLKGTGLFNPDAIQLVSRKVAAVSGDARRALDICRRSTELVKEGDPVTMATVDQALGQMTNSASVKAIKACSKMEKLFLQAVVSENQRTGIEETSFIAVYRQFQSLCAFSSVPVVNISQALSLLSHLGSSRLVLVEHARSDINQSVILNISSDDIHYALNQPTPIPA